MCELKKSKVEMLYNSWKSMREEFGDYSIHAKRLVVGFYAQATDDEKSIFINCCSKDDCIIVIDYAMELIKS